MKDWIVGALMLLVFAGCDRLPATSVNAPADPVEPNPAPAEVPAAPPLEIPAPQPAPPAAHVVDQDLLARATALQQQGNLAAARELVQPLVDQQQAGDELLDLLTEINRQLVFTPVPAPQKVDYTIAAGDSLSKIARQHGTTIDLIKKSNNLTSDLIRTGDRLRIYQGDWAVAVDKQANTLILNDRGQFFMRYRVGTGEYSKTPVGTYKINSRLKDPTWWRGDKEIPFGDPENILGTRWLGLDIAGFGIHGTWDNSSIGQQATAGCVRLRNEDVEELYTLLPLGTPVTIHE